MIEAAAAAAVAAPPRHLSSSSALDERRRSGTSRKCGAECGVRSGVMHGCQHVVYHFYVVPVSPSSFLLSFYLLLYCAAHLHTLLSLSSVFSINFPLFAAIAAAAASLRSGALPPLCLPYGERARATLGSKRSTDVTPPPPLPPVASKQSDVIRRGDRPLR